MPANRLLFAASLGALCATGLGAHAGAAHHAPPITTPKQAEAEAARRQTEQQAYEARLREAEAARLRYEAERTRYEEAQRRHAAQVERANAARARYDRRMAEREAERAERDERRSADAREATPSPVPTSEQQCEQRQQRDRRRGRAIGGVLGGVAGGFVGRGAGRVAAIALGAPVGALIGDSIARLLDCDEQRQAAATTEQVVSGSVGTTAAWRSETRPDVSGSSTFTSAEPTAPDGSQCITVTDIVIIDGEETRAPKRMCRSGPSARYARV